MQNHRILLIRHGETDWNKEQRWQGNMPVTLNDTGRKQAQKLAKFLRQSNIESIYSSDLSRAAETARIIASELGKTVQYDSRLQEVNLGVFQGLTRHEIMNKYKTDFDTCFKNWDIPVPQGESQNQVQKRMLAAWKDITSNAVGDETAIVSHGRAIRLLLVGLFAQQATTIMQQDIENTSFTVIERQNGQWTLKSIGKIDHYSTKL